MVSPLPFSFTDSFGTTLAAYHWAPAGVPRAAVQLVHGMGEHVLRYQGLAEAPCDAGMAVYGYDQRGHGASIDGEPGVIGADGWTALVADIGEFGRLIRGREPDVKVGVVAHSMGSFAMQQALLADSDVFDAVVLSGTAALDLLEPALDLSAPLDLAMFNAAFNPARTDYDWLTRDDEQVDRYVADPLCGFGLDVDAGRAMFVGAHAPADPAGFAQVRSGLPVLIAVGDQDPVNGALALFQPLVERFTAAGFDVTPVVYPGARHEIVNETNRAEVVDEIRGWLVAHLT